MTVVEAKGFFNLASAPAVTLNQPFSLFFGAGVVLILGCGQNLGLL
ncbi:hypothetical protein ECDEC5E_1276 [Escherichia coli DEC5E]|nr:hypothetical protein ECDEC5E_1276 [Escherichia coli DEC5E]